MPEKKIEIPLLQIDWQTLIVLVILILFGYYIK